MSLHPRGHRRDPAARARHRDQPVPIIAAILMLLSPRARATARVPARLGLGIVAAPSSCYSARLGPPAEPTDSREAVWAIKIVLGALLLPRAQQWREAPEAGREGGAAELDASDRHHDRRSAARARLPAVGGEPEEPADGRRAGVASARQADLDGDRRRGRRLHGDRRAHGRGPRDRSTWSRRRGWPARWTPCAAWLAQTTRPSWRCCCS